MRQLTLSLIFSSLFIINTATAPVAFAQEDDSINDDVVEPIGEVEPISDEPMELLVSAPRTANHEPAGAISSVISAFRYDPQVDLQDRNLAEAQSDVTIRGGTFDMTGIVIGAAPVYDPQTGHYTSDLPLPSSFLSSPSVITGSDNALAGFNSTSGSIQSTFSPTEDWNHIKLGMGDFRTNIQEVTAERDNVLDTDIGAIGVSSNFAHSTSNGTRQHGDSEFFRYAARAQLHSGYDRQTDLVYGYQSEDFRWPYLYAVKELHDLVGSSGIESESLDTSLVMLNHRQRISETGEVEFTSYYRRNHDDYEFDEFNKGLFNPYRHTTKVYGAGLQASEQFDKTYIGSSAQVYGDEIDSTALTFGNYDSRTLAKLTTYIGRKIDLEHDWVLAPMAGVAWDKSDHTSEQVSPIARLGVSKRTSDYERKVYAEYSSSTQLPNYTALNSNPSAGLFRGNKSLKRQVSRNSEVGYQYQTESFFVNSALFYRNDDDLTDWTYSSEIEPFAARTANNVDISTRGAEIFAAVTKGSNTLSSSYTLLDKSSDYETADVDASFYALNYPGHRVTSSFVTKPTDFIELRADMEFRKQYMNELRTSDDTTYLISSLSATFSITDIAKGFSLGVIVDNIGNENFEEVPGVPGYGRLTSVVANYVW